MTTWKKNPKKYAVRKETMAPRCEMCKRLVTEHCVSSTAASELKIYWREIINKYTGKKHFGTVCYKCKCEVDRPKKFSHDNEYREAYAQHTLGK